jgi:DNA-binding NarL/FixJ family response regulator
LSEGFEEPLTAREQDVLELLSVGLSNRRIAERLAISEHTVKFHVASIYGKLGVSGRTAAVNRALRRGILKI